MSPKQSETISRVEAVVSAYVGLIRMLGNARAPEFLEVGITMAQLKVLMLLGAVGEMRMSDMAAQLGVAMSTVTGLIDRLVEAGYAVRREDPADRRQVFVSVAPDGLAFIDRFQELNSSRLRELLSRLDDEDLAHIHESIRRLSAAAARGPLGPDTTAAAEPQRNTP